MKWCWRADRCGSRTRTLTRDELHSQRTGCPRLVGAGLPLAWLVGAGWLLLAAQPNHAAPRPLSLRECIELALEHNLDVQIERYGPEIARFNLRGAYGAYEPVFSFQAVRDFLEHPAKFDPDNFNPDYPFEATTDTVSAGFLGQLPSGLTYELGGRSDFTSADTDFSLDPDRAAVFPPNGVRHFDQYLVHAALTLRQPLLKDFWIDAPRLRIRVNKNALAVSKLALRWRIMRTITEVQQAYYELIYAREAVTVQQEALALAQHLLAETRKRVELGDLPPLDEQQAAAQAESTQADLYAAQQRLDDQRSALKQLLTDDYRAWIDLDPEPTERLPLLAVVLDRHASWEHALEHRPDLAQLRLQIQTLELNTRFARNQLFPSLDLVGSVGARGVDPDFGPAAGDVADFRSPAHSYGVVLRVPVGNTTARNQYRANKAAQEQARLQVKKAEQTILLEVDTALSAVESAFKRVNATRQARQFAEAALAAEEKKLRNGTSTSFLVLQFQERLTKARTAEIRALADYNQATARLALTEGRVLEANGLSLEE